MKTPTIKLTTLLQAALFATLGGYIGAEYATLKNAADMQVLQETGYINKAKTMPIYVDSTTNGVY